ncbi:MAG: hypothetical protein ACK5TQ_02620, partial [Acetobacteraceae bacterium]
RDRAWRHQAQARQGLMQSTYQATIRLPSGGLAKVSVEATSLNHARQLLELQYGKNRVMDLHQRS